MRRPSESRRVRMAHISRRAVGPPPRTRAGLLASTWLKFGDHLSGMGRKHAAIRAFRRSIALRENGWRAWRGLAEAEMAAGRLGSATVAYHRLLALRPDLASGWYHLGRLYHRLGYPGRSAEAFGRSLRLSRANRAYRAIIGLGEERLGVGSAILPCRTYLLH